MEDENSPGGQPSGVPKVNLSKDAPTGAHAAPEPPPGSPLQPPPAPGSYPTPPSSPPPQGLGGEADTPMPRRSERRPALLFVLVGVAVVVGVVWLAVGRGGSGDDTGEALGDSTTTQQVVPPSRAEVETTVDEPEQVQTTTSTSVPPETVPAPGPLRPTEVLASGGLPATTLRCTGETIDYGAERLIDGDLQTGWGVSGDGAGRSITVRFADPVHLTQVGLVPGYAKVGPRADFDCRDVGAFDLNRVIVRASYRFADGSEVEQTFEPRPEMQSAAVDVVTTSVTITILETRLPPGADDDTVLSEVAFEGRAV